MIYAVQVYKIACAAFFIQEVIMNIKEYLSAYYRVKNENDRLISRCGRVEYITTMKYIEKYLKPNMFILEIGAATGRYSHALAQNGYKVDAIELVESNIDIFKKNTIEGENITITQGNAVDLAFIKSNTYDITLLLGPMYHLFTEDDKLKALSEAIRVTKKDGIIFVAYCMSDPTILNFGFKNNEIFNLIEKGMINTENFETYSRPQDIIELCKKEDIDKLRNNFKVKQLHFVAADGYANHMKETINEMSDKMYDIYIKYHLTTCERQDLIGYSYHTIDIFRKE